MKYAKYREDLKTCERKKCNIADFAAILRRRMLAKEQQTSTIFGRTAKLTSFKQLKPRRATVNQNAGDVKGQHMREEEAGTQTVSSAGLVLD